MPLIFTPEKKLSVSLWRISICFPGSTVGTVMPSVSMVAVTFPFPSFASVHCSGTLSAVPPAPFTVTLSRITPVTAYFTLPSSTEAEPEAVAASVVLVLSTETPKDSGAPVTVPAALPPISVIDWPQGSAVTAANVRPFKLVTASALKMYFVFL